MAKQIDKICRYCLYWLPCDHFKEGEWAYGYCQHRDAYKPEHLTCSRWQPKSEYLKQEETK